MQLLEVFSGDGLLLMLTHLQQLQRRPLLVSRIPLLRYFLRHVCLHLLIENNCVCLQFETSYVRLQFKSSRIGLQFEINHVDLHLGLRVPRSLHLISHS
jgi:hypothetical protein